MPHIFQTAGEAALAAVMRRRPVLGFDFDGTLAPIVARPEEARISPSLAGKLRRLAAVLPVVIVSGRRADDLLDRLGFVPRQVVGNHGADLRFGPESAAALDAARRILADHRPALTRAGVTIEDKGLSLALHYRLAQDKKIATDAIRKALEYVSTDCSSFTGKMVENVVAAEAPDKGSAMHSLVRQYGATCAVFLGDDVNDEPVFASAPADWLTIRVGREDTDSRAQYFMDNTLEVDMLVDRMLVHLAIPH
jgi:trehalose 6-phosphate phosphatase